MSADSTPAADDATAEATTAQPSGSGPLAGARPAAAVDPHPEAKVGKAFAGGLAAAFVLRRMAKRKHRA